MAIPAFAMPFAFVFDGRTCEAASPVQGGAASGMTVLPASGILIRQGPIATWRESLTTDQAAARWRALGGDEAFALPPAQQALRIDGVRIYALVRRGQDRAHVDLTFLQLKANAPLRAWAERLSVYLRADVRAALLG